MWEFLEDWFSQLQHQFEMRLSRLVRDVDSSIPKMAPVAHSPVEMGNSLLGAAAPSVVRPAVKLSSPNSYSLSSQPGLFGNKEESNSFPLSAHPDLFGNDKSSPVHVVVDNPEEMKTSPAPGARDSLGGLMDRLRDLHSNEYKNANPEQFDSPTFDIAPRPTSAQRAGHWISSGGRMLQSASGRLWQSSIPGAQMAASTAGRTGSLMQTVGGALSAGGPAAAAAGTAAAIISLPMLAAAFVSSTKKMGEGLLESQRHLSQWNGSIANAVAMSDVHKMRLDARLASATADNVAQLGESMKKLREATQGVREGFTNIGLSIANFAVNIASKPFEIREVISNSIADMIAKIMGTTEELAEERKAQEEKKRIADINGPGRQFMAALGRQQAAPRPPLRPIP